MCGILGVWSKQAIIHSSELITGLSKIEHRGPDAKNIWIAPNQKVGLGHARLSIIGLNNGIQPLFNVEKEIYAVVNGEFYDFLSIKEKYQKQGYHFATETDSEILIPLYLEYGLHLFSHLNGEFAFILWDQRKQQLICGRDRFGIKPLFYTFQNEVFYAASEIKALFGLGIKAEWDEHNSACIFQGALSPSRSCFKHIRQVRPGHFLVVTASEIKEHEYWNFRYQKLNVYQQYTDEEWIALFREKLYQAVKRRLVADIPVGFYLSGGVDSSAILALAAEINPRLQAFNVSFEEDAFDEKKFAKEMADHIEIPLLSIKVGEKDLAQAFSKAIFHRESFVYQLNGIAKYLLSQEVQKAGYKVVLTGEGADEILAGYPFFKEDLLNCLTKDRKEFFMKQLQASHAHAGVAFVSQGDYNSGVLEEIKAKLGYFPSFWKMGFDIGIAIQSTYSDEFALLNDSLNGRNALLEEVSIKNIENTHFINKSSYLFCKSFLPELILSYLGDRMEMAHSIEGRLPFLDIELVEFITHLPVHLKIKKFKEKFILYESVKHLIPDAIYRRTKHAFEAPPVICNQRYYGGPFEELIQDVLHSQRFANLPFFNAQKAIHLFSRIKNMERRQRTIAESAITFMISAYFLDEHFINPG